MTYSICPACGHENSGIDPDEEEPVCEICDGYLDALGEVDPEEEE